VSAPKPLNVRVAAALGWKEFRQDLAGRWMGIMPRPEYPHGPDIMDYVPPFGEDTPDGWACTGPLISRFHICLTTNGIGRNEWAADEGTFPMVHAEAPLIAVCNYVLNRAQSGRLLPESPR
jgi:hypothetical protein